MRKNPRTYARVLQAIESGRTKHEGKASEATHEAHTTYATIDKYAPGLRYTDALGRSVFRDADRLPRRLHVGTTRGDMVLTVRGSRAASTVGRHANAVKEYLEHGDPSALAEFEGKRIAGHALETDLDALDEQARAGEWDWLQLYEGMEP